MFRPKQYRPPGGLSLGKGKIDHPHADIVEQTLLRTRDQVELVKELDEAEAKLTTLKWI